MATIYVDYNIIVKAVDQSERECAGELREQFGALARPGHRFALSAWHAFELAQSGQQDHVDACCQFVESLRPLWLSNSAYVKREELRRYLHGTPDGRPVAAFNDFVSQMWATYGGGSAVVIGDTFTNTVRQLRETPNALAEVQAAAKETPEAILIGRAARDRGVNVPKELIDREYFASYLHWADRLCGVPQRLVENKGDVISKCPAVAVDEHLTLLGVGDSFNPKPSDAADLQHATVALAYCDHFVTGDGRLAGHCAVVVRRCGLRCTVHRALSELLPPGASAVR